MNGKTETVAGDHRLQRFIAVEFVKDLRQLQQTYQLLSSVVLGIHHQRQGLTALVSFVNGTFQIVKARLGE